MARLAILFTLFLAATAAVLPVKKEKAAPYCNPAECLPPDCRCSTTDTPGSFTRTETPQTVLITFDDEVNSFNYYYYYTLLFRRPNPNGCPVKATYFLSHEYNNYTLVADLYNRGHEIASHSITHRTNYDFWTAQNVTTWEREMADMRTMIEYFTDIPVSAIKGARAPFLLTGGDAMWTALSNNGFEWDCSWPTRNYVDPGMWPYTLDYRSIQDCQVGVCPENSFPGKWVVPMIDLTDANGNPCTMIDTCTFGNSSTEVFEILKTNFEVHYNGNRSPFGLFVQSAWLADSAHLDGYKMFLDFLTEKDDVYMVSISQLIEWVKNPTPVKNIASFQPWRCPDFTSVPCISRTCSYIPDRTPFGSERYMYICNRGCPSFYPWYENIYGRDPPTPWVP